MYVYNVYDIAPFYRDADSVCQAACHDDKQYIMTRVLSYGGYCERRTEFSFTCEFDDGSISEITWTRDILCEVLYATLLPLPYDPSF